MQKFGKIRLVIFFIYLVYYPASAQEITLNECYQKAKQNYPLIKRNELITKSKDYNIQNAAKGWLPQFNISAQISYQSDVTEIPIKIQGVNIDPLSKDQYKAVIDVSQNIFDGGNISNQKKAASTQSDIEIEKNNVDLDKLKERINQLYFGILMTDEQLRQTDFTKQDIENGIVKAEAQLKNGVIFRSNLEVLKAQLLVIEQRQIEYRNVRRNFLDMLSMFIHQKLDDDTILEEPEKLILSSENNRSELKLFDFQKQYLDIQKLVVKTRNLPKLSLFFQGGYGKPGLNMLKNEFDTFYIGGLRLNIPITGFYTQKNDLKIIKNQQDDIEILKENFLFNQSLESIQNKNELEKIQNLIDKDGELIILRENIKKASLAQLDNGVADTNDYLREVNAEEQAKILKIQHEIQYLLVQYNQRALYNN